MFFFYGCSLFLGEKTWNKIGRLFLKKGQKKKILENYERQQ